MSGYVKLITWFGQPAAVACDGRCDKAWGINNRPKESLSTDEDDYAYLADGELGEAPADPGTYEGDKAKPLPDEPKLNKWCVRECERCKLYGHLERNANEPPETLPDFSQRVFNMPHLHLAQGPTQ